MQMKFLSRLTVIGATLTVVLAAAAADISGAGATFPYPIYAKWADAYKKLTGVGLNYQSIGSGGGIKQIKAKTVTFGASDMPLKPDPQPGTNNWYTEDGYGEGRQEGGQGGRAERGELRGCGRQC